MQAQISLIERGCVNLSLETFIQLARALQLEPMLVPRKYIPLVQSLARGDMGAAATHVRRHERMMTDS